MDEHYFERAEEGLYRAFHDELRARPQTPHRQLTLRYDQSYALILDGAEDWEPLAAEESEDWDEDNYEFLDAVDDGFEPCDLGWFLVSVLLARIALRLKADPALSGYWAPGLGISIDVDGYPDGPVMENTSIAPGDRQRLVALIAAEPANRALLLDLWSDRLCGEGRALLESLGIER